METIIKTNPYQTEITEDLREELGHDVFSELMAFIESVPWVRSLIAADRFYVEDLELDEQGRAIVDFENPHILTGMDFFIETRLNYERTGKFCHYEFSRDPHSEYMQFWTEERRRGIDGYVREDGEWISGYNYFYWNYGWIEKTVRIGETTKLGLTRAKRVDWFPDLWETDYFYYHYIEQAEQQGLFGALLKSRGKGASYKTANMGVRNLYLIKNSNTFYMAAYDGYLYEDGIMNKLQFNMTLMEETAFKKKKLKDSLESVKLGYKDKYKNNAESGYLSTAVGVNVKDPNKARGKRGKLLAYEEAGSNTHLLKAWGISEESINQSGDVYGFQIAFGTGGDEHSDFRGLTTLFNRPGAYSVYAIPNVFDKNSSHRKSGFFIGYYMNTSGNYNEDGVTDIVASLAQIFLKREKLRNDIDNPDELAQKFAETAMTPVEAMTVISEITFPVQLAKARILLFTANQSENTAHHHHVELSRVGLHVSLIHGTTKPINSYPYKGTHASTASLVLSHLPETHQDGTPVWGRYIIGLDTLDSDGGIGSLFAFQIMDLWKDIIVGWYIGRKQIIEDDYELCLSAAILYNATINYENNLKGFYGFCKNKNALHYLCDTPSILADKGMSIKKGNTIGNSSKGTRATAPINNYGRLLQNTWLRKEHISDPNLIGLDTVEDMEYLTEISLWDVSGNFDKVSCGNMLFILREDRQHLLSHSSDSDDSDEDEYNSDPFISGGGIGGEFYTNDFSGPHFGEESDEYYDDE